MRISWSIILILLNLLNHYSVDQIIVVHAGETIGHSFHQPKYRIEFHSAESTFHPDDDQESLVMSNKSGHKFLCFLPRAEKIKTGKLVSQQNTSNMVVEFERQIKLKTPDELLDVIKGKCIYLHDSWWWTYEFCYKKTVRQFHMEKDKVVQEFLLGVYDDEATSDFNRNLSDVSTLKDPRSKDASQRYHAHQFTNGTLCDLTNQPRETEVRFVCSESPRVMIKSITELSTCKYALIVECPMLCKHQMFQEERPVWQTINCKELPNENNDIIELEKANLKDELINMDMDIDAQSSDDLEEQHDT